MKKGFAHDHNATVIGINDERLSPPKIVNALGVFDLDPCSPIKRPWPTAKNHYTIEDDGLFMPWYGRVWMNPPYGKTMGAWLNKLALHGDGIALTFARTDTQAFQQYVFQHASSIFFLSGRLKFYDVNGNELPDNAGAPSALIAYGKNNMEAIGDSGLKGKHLLINYTPLIVIGVDRTWKTVVSMSLEKLNGKGTLEAIYKVVKEVAPEKVLKNDHYEAKVRQTLQTFFTKIKRGEYTNSIEQVA